MEKIFLARIKWCSFEDGGRKNVLPQGVRYCPLIHLEHTDNKEDWNIDFICPDFDKTDLIHFKFLSPNAPQDLVLCGHSYYVYEGGKKVAHIEVLS